MRIICWSKEEFIDIDSAFFSSKYKNAKINNDFRILGEICHRFF